MRKGVEILGKTQSLYTINALEPGSFKEYAGMAFCNKLLITGATSQIGFSLMKELLSTYPKLSCVLASRNTALLKSLVKKLDMSNQGRIEIIKLPLTAQDIPTFVKEIQGIDAAIVCQGSYGTLGHFSEVNLDQFLDSLFSQLKSVIVTLRALSNLECVGLRIVVIGGGGASQAYEGLAEYGMVKSSIARLVETLSLEFHPEKLAINFLGPGPTYSDMADSILDAKSNNSKIDKRIIESSNNLKFRNSSISQNLVNACEYLLSDRPLKISGKFISSIWDSPKRLESGLEGDSYSLRRVIPLTQTE